MDTAGIGMKISREERKNFGYVDSVSIEVEREYYARGRRVPNGFTWYTGRAERLAEERLVGYRTSRPAGSADPA